MTKYIKEPLNLRKTCERKLLRGIGKSRQKIASFNILYKFETFTRKTERGLFSQAEQRERKNQNIIVKQKYVCFLLFLAHASITIQSHIRLWTPIFYKTKTIFHIEVESDWDHPKGFHGNPTLIIAWKHLRIVWIPWPSCGSNDSCGLRPAAVAIGAIGLVPPAPSVPQSGHPNISSTRCNQMSKTGVGVPLFLETPIQVRVKVMPKSCLLLFPNVNANLGKSFLLVSPNVSAAPMSSYRCARQGIFQESKKNDQNMCSITWLQNGYAHSTQIKDYIIVRNMFATSFDRWCMTKRKNMQTFALLCLALNCFA